MKLLISALSLLSVLFSSESMAKTTLVDFGGTSNSFSSPWNLSTGTNPVLSTDRKTAALKDTTGATSSVVVTYQSGSPLLITAPSSDSQLTTLTANQAVGSYGLAMWKAAHGFDLTDARIQRGWEERSLLSVGSIVDPGNISMGGFSANSSYTVSAVFTVSGLANILSIKNAPVTLQGNNFNLSHAYLAGSNGELIDLVQVGNVELAGLLSKGTFMMTWQLQTTSSFNTSSTINIDFANSLLGLGGGYGISAMAVTDSTPDLPVPPVSVPEPSSALLGAFGFVGLIVRRRRK